MNYIIHIIIMSQQDKLPVFPTRMALEDLKFRSKAAKKGQISP